MVRISALLAKSVTRTCSRCELASVDCSTSAGNAGWPTRSTATARPKGSSKQLAPCRSFGTGLIRLSATSLMRPSARRIVSMQEKCSRSTSSLGCCTDLAASTRWSFNSTFRKNACVETDARQATDTKNRRSFIWSTWVDSNPRSTPPSITGIKRLEKS
ncbi:hypothetical protein D3C71_929100 [compost metagenome]